VPAVTHQAIEVWAQLYLCSEDASRIRAFFQHELGLSPKCVSRRPHLTVYHGRRPMPGLHPLSEPADVTVLASETRFMVLAPGGENPRPELDPATRKVGIRVHRQSMARAAIYQYRQRLLTYETPAVLGRRAPSSRKRSAFGARDFQPHMTLLLPGNRIGRDLTKVGKRFRAAFVEFRFDRFVIDIVQKGTRATQRAATRPL
jgi:hypothetical protein